MTIFFSASAGGFLNDDIHKSLPADAVKITFEHYCTLLDGQSNGKLIRLSVDGLPELVDPPALAIVDAMIDAERDRRIDAGLRFAGVLYQSKTTDRENIAGAAQMAFMAVVGGVQAGNLRWSNPDQDFAWICAENTLVPMDAQTVVEFGRAAALRKSELIYAGRALKDLPEIPENFTDDAWWPA